MNNPIRFIDPDGRSSQTFEGQDAQNAFWHFYFGGSVSNFNGSQSFSSSNGNQPFNSYIDAGGSTGGGGGSIMNFALGDGGQGGGSSLSGWMQNNIGSNSGPGNPHPFTASEINQLLSAGLLTAATAKMMVGAIALEGAGAGVATGTATSSATGAWATVLTRTIALGLLLSIKNEAPPTRYYVYVIQGQDDIAKFGITRQSDPANRPQSQISGINNLRPDKGPHSWQWLQGPVSKESAFLYEKYYVWEYSQKVGRMPYAQKYPYSDALIRELEKFIKGK